MKKISYFELSFLLITIITTFNSGINLYIIKNDTGIDSWIAIIIAYIIGFIPLVLVMYIASYKKNLNLFEKNKYLFGNILGNIINIIIVIILFIIALVILYNIISFITTQFLYHTPMLVSSILLILLSIYCSSKEINVITHVNFILVIISLIIFIISILSITNEIHLDNLLPILKTNNNAILYSSIKIAIINILPILLILIIPKDKITNEKKYNKALFWAYIIGFLITLLTIVITISALNIYLVKAYEFPEYMVLKKIKLFGFLERVENIISIQWITESFIYITLIIYSIGKYFIKNNNQKELLYNNFFIGSLLVLISNTIFKNITIFNNFTNNIFINIVTILIFIYIITILKIIINKILNINS